MAGKAKPFLNIGPGQIIKRNLEAMNWTSKDLAEVIGMSEKSVSKLLNNKQSVTVPTARLLGKAFGTSPEFWLNLEQNYRLRKVEEGKPEEETAIRAEIRKRMPILDMKKKGWISYDRTAKSQIDAYKRFWKLTKTDFSVYERESLAFRARRGKSDDENTLSYSVTWFQKAKTEAEKIKATVYVKEKAEKLAELLPKLTVANNGVVFFIDRLQTCGVKFILLDHLEKTRLDGACFLDDTNPVLVYTARHDRVDNFWWTVTHELAHILLHLITTKDYFIDDLDEPDAGNANEREADAWAARHLFVDKILAGAEPYRNYMTETRLKEIADSVGLDGTVVLGILKHCGILDWRTLPRLRRTVRDLIPVEYDRNRG